MNGHGVTMGLLSSCRESATGLLSSLKFPFDERGVVNMSKLVVL